MEGLKKPSRARCALSGKIDLAGFQPIDQLGWRQIDQDHVVGALEHGYRARFRSRMPAIRATRSEGAKVLDVGAVQTLMPAAAGSAMSW